MLAKNNARSIVFIMSQLGLGGAEKQLFLLVRGLLRLDWRISILTLNPGKGDYWEKPLSELEIPVVPIFRSSHHNRVLTIARQLKSENASIVHGWTLSDGSYANLSGMLAGVPIRLGGARGFPSKEASSLVLQATALYGLDSVIFNSHIVADALKARFGRLSSPFKVIHNAVESYNSSKRETLRATLANKWGLKPDYPWIIAIGRLDKNKNIGMLLNAIRLVVNHNNHFYLIVIGDGPERSFLETERERLKLENTVKFVGAIPNASSFLPAFDMLCLISLKEGMPNVVMEASAAALPVIASRVGGVPALINDEITGYLVDPGNVSQLASRILSLLNDPYLRLQMGKAGMKKMQCEFSTDDMVFRFNGLYLAQLEKRWSSNV